MDTKTFVVGSNHFCVYCGREVEDTGGYADRCRYEEYKCDCSKAKAEIEYRNNIKRNEENIRWLTQLSSREIDLIKLEEEIKQKQAALNKLKEYMESNKSK